MRITSTVLGLLALLGATSVEACSCIPPPPPKKALEQSTAVFSGKVVKINRVGDHNHVTFAVDQSWKGAAEKNLTVVTHVHGATCGYGFELEKKYIVYCYGAKDEKLLRTGLCTRTATLANAKQDLKDLGAGRKPGE